MKPYKGRPIRETQIEQQHRRVARSWGWFVEKIMLTGRRGFPDRFYASGHPKHTCRLCGRGRIVLIEWKRPSGTSQEQQDIRIVELRAAGVEVHVVKSLIEANQILGIGNEKSLREPDL